MRLSVLLIFLASIAAGAQTQTAKVSTKPGSAKPSPLILEKDEGEKRVRRPRNTPIPAPGFIIKVDRVNGGSRHFYAGAEDIPPGGTIPFHRHHGQDEILVIQTGSAHVWLGDQERDVHAGAMVFIPSESWVSLKNTGNEPIRLAFIFSAPGFDESMRCSSVAEGAPAPPISDEDLASCQHKGHAEFGRPAAPHQ